MATEVQWSELQRDPKAVAKLADQGAVRVRRRDGAPLILVREDAAQNESEGAIIAARAVRSAVRHLPHDAVISVLVDEFPWVDLLPEKARAEFVTDFARAFHASAELGQWSIFMQTIREWHSTALVYADPELARALTQPTEGDFGPVPSPMGE
ncbi:hypothetical protein [Nocardia arthritidis]|uniref:Prevent-host-death protein n=1 Tax=Nocardia arthritidis TaxID=228602 RepID=A0A6G9YP20_9NOCA|nr:hypothetical protein [Nocardia arthritidis]QIS14827.1 hypothetical protein F5544_34970 [Nocardia arthritidis]